MHATKEEEEEEAVKVLLASVSSGVTAIAERCGCLVIHLTSSFHTVILAVENWKSC